MTLLRLHVTQKALQLSFFLRLRVTKKALQLPFFSFFFPSFLALFLHGLAKTFYQCLLFPYPRRV